jgi:tetrahydromethanopterin S-methyltransferase subunit B
MGKKPSVPMADIDVNLPPNWRTARDSDGKEYYFNELTGETSWNLPEAEPPAQADDDESKEMELTDQPGTVAIPDYGTARRKSSGKYAELESLIGERVLPRLLIIVVCSVIVMLQSAVGLGLSSTLPNAGYGLTVGLISLLLAMFLIVFAKLKPAMFSNFVIPKVPGELSIMKASTILFVLWWTPGTLILTFFNPYTTTGDSYFAAWAALIASLLILVDSFTRIGEKFKQVTSMRTRQEPQNQSLAGLAIASSVMTLASLQYIGAGFKAAVFGLIVGLISVVCAIIMKVGTDRGRIGAPALSRRPLTAAVCRLQTAAAPASHVLSLRPARLPFL